jgi:hypothetical protein
MRLRLLAAPLLLPRSASACAICFGAVDTHKSFFDGLAWAILILLSITLSLIGTIGWAVWSIERRRAEKDA